MLVPDNLKPALLVALYKRSRPQGMGFLAAMSAPEFTEDDAREVLEKQNGYVDYLHGRPIKVDFRGPRIDFRLFDRDAGPGAGESVALDVLTDPTR